MPTIQHREFLSIKVLAIVSNVNLEKLSAKGPKEKSKRNQRHTEGREKSLERRFAQETYFLLLFTCMYYNLYMIEKC